MASTLAQLPLISPYVAVDKGYNREVAYPAVGCPHAVPSCGVSTCRTQLWGVHMPYPAVGCPHAVPSCGVSTCRTQLWGVHMPYPAVGCPHAVLSCGVSTCRTQLWGVHMPYPAVGCLHIVCLFFSGQPAIVPSYGAADTRGSRRNQLWGNSFSF